MNYKEAFLNSLSDEQLGIFHAHEFAPNLEDVLQDHITVIQYNLFAEWKSNEATAEDHHVPATEILDSTRSDSLVAKLDTLTSLLIELTTRVDIIDSKLSAIEALNDQVADLTKKLTVYDEKIMQIETLNVQVTSMTAKLAEFDGKMMQIDALKDQVAGPATNPAGIDRQIVQIDTLNNKVDDVTTKQNETDEYIVQLCLSSLTVLDTESLCKKWLQMTLNQVYDSDVSQEKKDKIGSKENIEKIVSAMKKFKGNDEIELYGCKTLSKLAEISSVARTSIVEGRAITHVKDLFVEYWPTRHIREATVDNTILVFAHLSRFSTVQNLLTDSYFNMLQIPSNDPEFSKYALLAGNVLHNLQTIHKMDWNYTLSKAKVDDALLKSISRWPLGECIGREFPSFAWAFNNLDCGTKSQKLYCAWCLANYLMINPQKYVTMLKQEGAIPKIVTLISKKSLDADIKKLVDIAVDILMK